MKNETILYAANSFWVEARSRVMSVARREGIPAVIKKNDDEFLFDLYDNGATIPDDITVVKGLLEYVGMVPDEPLEILTEEIVQVWITPGILPANDNCRLAPDTLRGVWGRAYKAGVCWLRVREGWVHEKSVLVQESLQGPEVKPQTPDQADDASVQPTAVTAEDVLKLIRFHNLTVDTFERVGKAVKVDGWLFGGMEMWHRIACEGAEIVGVARRLGIDATINMQKGEIILKWQQNR